MSVDEIYDVKVLHNKVRPNILSTDMDTIKAALTFNNKYFWGELKNENDNNNNSKIQQQAPPNALQVQVLKNISPSDLLQQFGNMLCVDFKADLSSKKIHNNLNLLIAAQNNNPIGLIIFDAKQNKSSRIYSVFIKDNFRQKGLASQLIKHLLDILQQNKIEYIEANFDANKIDAEITKKLFSKFDDVNLIVK